MKYTSLLFFIFLYSISFGQAISRDVVTSFWNNNIRAIVEMDDDKIIRQTQFPVNGSWGYAVELKEKPENWVENDFTSNLDKIFNEDTRSKLAQKTYNDIVHYRNEAGELIFIVNVDFLTTDEISGDTYESSTIFFFKQFESKWKLFSIEYAG